MKGLFEEHYTNLNGGKQADPDQKFDWIYQKQKILERKKEEMAELERQKALKKNKKGIPSKKEAILQAQ